MKSIFNGFYSTTSEDLRDVWSSQNTLFVFDTNCLFNLYRCEEHTREEILAVMREISSRTWIPFQVAFEYQRGRRGIIERSISSLIKIKSELQKIDTQNILASAGIKKQLYHSLSDELSQLQNQIKNSIDDYINGKIEERIQAKENISKHDFIRDNIDIIINDKIGPIPTQEEIDKINEEGITRYEKKIPPGFQDESKKSVSYFSGIQFQDKYGDLYLWKQLIEKAKSGDITNVIFICDDNKPDWWFAASGKTHGPLESLKTEICAEAQLSTFRMVNQTTFLHEANNNLLNINISDSSLKEVEELSSKTLIPEDTSSLYKNISVWKSIFPNKNEKINHDESHESYFLSEIYNGHENFEIASQIRRNLRRAQIILSDGIKTADLLINNQTELLEIIDIDKYNHAVFSIKSSIVFLEHTINKTKQKLLSNDWSEIVNASGPEAANRYLLQAMEEIQILINVAFSYLDLLKQQ